MKLYLKSVAYLVGGLALAQMTTSCVNDPNSPGVEYMPDMYRSVAVEAYVDYSNLEESSVRKPVEGTIAFNADPTKAQFNMPYPYVNTPEGYEEAGAALTNLVKLTPEVLAEGQDLYTKFCMHCHGEKGLGDGAVVTNGGYPPPPSYAGPLKDLSVGKMFHTITFGKGQMGSHASQVNKEERWKIIHYVNVLQNDGVSPFDAN
jgi:mono/diheme cytochrome c family protein